VHYTVYQMSETTALDDRADKLDAGAFPRQPKLLVVDDQPMHIQVLYRSLAPACQVFMATQGEQAVKLSIEKQPDLVLLDVEMPNMDGFAVMSALKSHPATRHIPVIFVTAHTSEEMETRGLESGAVDFISKPINPSVVRARVNTQLKLKFQSDLLREWVFIDGLTGAYNRRYFDNQFEIEWARAVRSDQPLSLVMIDVDHFKAYNDHYGHMMGDEALRSLVSALRPELQRPGDLLARYGGEEFVCLLPNTPLPYALTVAERLRTALQSKGIPHDHNPSHGVLTISLGVAESKASNATNTEALIVAADKQLYSAKTQGKNRVSG
jgi:diguanylate cyclase (GGDEF)-like protein